MFGENCSIIHLTNIPITVVFLPKRKLLLRSISGSPTFVQNKWQAPGPSTTAVPAVPTAPEPLELPWDTDLMVELDESTQPEAAAVELKFFLACFLKVILLGICDDFCVPKIAKT